MLCWLQNFYQWDKILEVHGDNFCLLYSFDLYIFYFLLLHHKFIASFYSLLELPVYCSCIKHFAEALAADGWGEHQRRHHYRQIHSQVHQFSVICFKGWPFISIVLYDNNGFGISCKVYWLTVYIAFCTVLCFYWHVIF